MSGDVLRVMNQARVRQWKKEDQEDLAQETWLRSIATGHEHEPKYMTGTLKNVLLKTITKKKTQDRYAKDIIMTYYTKDNSLAEAHLKEDIVKCAQHLNPVQKRIFDELERNPEGTQEEWSENLNIARRTLGYHLLNIRAIFKSLLEDNKTPVYSAGYLNDRRFNG